VDLLKSKIKNGAYPSRGVRIDYEPILARIAHLQSRSRPGGGARTAIVNHGNPGAWYDASATAATTVGCTSDAEVLKGVLDSLD